MHVDGASGGFVAPFLDPTWSGTSGSPRVASINTSGHKYGLVYPGVGWVVWRDAAALPEELIFNVNYLGGEMPTFALNFSRPGGQVVAQYYNFLRLGLRGLPRACSVACQRGRAVHRRARSRRWARSSCSPTARPAGARVPPDRPGGTGYTVFDVSERLRQRGWLVPAYTFPANLQDVAVLRIVVRNGFSRDLAGLLVDDLRAQVKLLEAAPQRPVPLFPEGHRSAFAH